MNINQFKTIGYFIQSYFNWSVDYSELDRCIRDFLTSENEDKINACRKEVETLYILNDPDLIREVFYRLGDRGMPTDKALNMIKRLYCKTQKKESDRQVNRKNSNDGQLDSLRIFKEEN